MGSLWIAALAFSVTCLGYFRLRRFNRKLQAIKILRSCKARLSEMTADQERKRANEKPSNVRPTGHSNFQPNQLSSTSSLSKLIRQRLPAPEMLVETPRIKLNRIANVRLAYKVRSSTRIESGKEESEEWKRPTDLLSLAREAEQYVESADIENKEILDSPYEMVHLEARRLRDAYRKIDRLEFRLSEILERENTIRRSAQIWRLIVATSAIVGLVASVLTVYQFFFQAPNNR